MVKRTIVGAHYGIRDWLVQRLSALVMAAYSLLFVAILIVCSPSDHDQWRELFAPTWMRLATFVFFLSLLWHAWIGMRDILMDYVRPAGLRLSLETAVALTLVAYGGWAIQILWGL